MITESGNELAEKILSLQRQNEEIAQRYAVEFARREQPNDKSAFQKYAAIADVYREMHTIVCAGLHAVEAEMMKEMKT